VSASIHQLPVTIGDLTLVRRLGAGGMAEVFLATRPAAGDAGEETVVVKRMLPHLSSQEAYRALFRREAAIGLRVTDRHVVRTHGLVESDDGLMLVVEFIDGATLRALAKHAYERRAAIPLSLILRMFANAADGLAAIHATTDEQGRPFVHRDISPDNLIVGRDGVTRVLDFGVARPGGDVVLTRTGEIRGKLPFMPPEQLDARPLDGRCDLYALGVSLFWMLTGRRPFVHRSEIRLMQMIMRDRAPRVRSIAPEVPVALDELVDRLLAKEARQRPSSAAEVADRLHALGAGHEADVGSFVAHHVDDDPGTEAVRRARASSSSSSPLDAGRPRPRVALLSREGDDVGLVGGGMADVAAVPTAAVATLASASEWGGGEHEPPDEVVPVAETAATRSQSAGPGRGAAGPVVVGVAAGALVAVVVVAGGLAVGWRELAGGGRPLAPTPAPAVAAPSVPSAVPPAVAASPSLPSPSSPSPSSPSLSPSPSSPSPSPSPTTSSSSSSTASSPPAAPPAAAPAAPPRPAPSRPASSSSPERGRTVVVTGAPDQVVWRVAGREIGRGNGPLVVGAGVATLEALVDGGRVSVPVRDGAVAWDALPRGTLSVRAHEGAIELGATRWEVPARVRLVAGRYVVRFVDDAGRRSEHPVEVRAGAVTPLNLTGAP
jgi:serine/threonine-protein kinase